MTSSAAQPKSHYTTVSSDRELAKTITALALALAGDRAEPVNYIAVWQDDLQYLMDPIQESQRYLISKLYIPCMSDTVYLIDLYNKEIEIIPPPT